MGVKLASSSGGSVEIVSPVTASNYTATLQPATGTLLTSNASGDFTTTNFNSASTFGFKNRLINGGFGVFQRTSGGSSTPAAGATAYVASDRWFISQTGTTASLFQSSSASTTTGVAYSGYFGRNSGQTNVPTVIFFGQQIESKNMIDLRGQTITVSFNAFRGANAPTTLSVVCRFGTGTDEASGGGITGSWTGYSAGTASALTIGTAVAQYTYSVTVPSNASEMNLLFYYTPTGTAGANEWFALENVQLEKGSTATSFDYRPYGTELQLCQRYYIRLTTGNVYTALALGLCSGATSGQFHYFPPQPMRTTPSFGNSGSGTFQFSNGSSAQPLTSLAIASTQSCPVAVTISVGASGGGMTAGNAYRVEGANNGSAFVDFSAEL